MFLYGDKIVNDFNINKLIDHLFLIKAIRGRDYIYYSKDKIILLSTPKIRESPLCFYYHVENVNRFCKYIGRVIDTQNKIITDYVYNKNRPGNNSPFTLGWTYDYTHTSVIHSIMKLVNMIPISKRDDKKYMCTFLCSKIDSCNDRKHGIIEGRWKSTFTGGIKPSEWLNSSHVFSERIKYNNPVKYGQCWVLADLLTGIYNFLGLPARSIKIKNSIMDIHNTLGIDYYRNNDSANAIIMKSDSEVIFNPLEMISEYRIIYESLDLDVLHTLSLDHKTLKVITKGPIFDLEKDLNISPNDMVNLNYFVEDNLNKTWNFHIWTEVFLDNQWYIFDPCPLHDLDDSFKPYNDTRKFIQGNHFFGPVSVSDLKINKVSNDLIYNFRYIYACINGQLRYWSPFVTNDGKTILYLNQIKYDDPSLYERDTAGELINVTSRYRSNYDTFHKYHPIFMKIKDNTLSKIYIYINSNYVSNFVIQFTLFYGNTPLYIHREKISNLNLENLAFLKSPSIEKYRSKADKLTFCVYDISNNHFWNQCIQI